MTIDKHMVPENEMERLFSLSAFEIDFSDPQKDLDNLAKLAAKIAGTNISLINLIDSYTQWTISRHGLEIDQMLREDSACQYTIMQDGYFEVSDMSVDERFKNKLYVTGGPLAKYYLGVPLTLGNGLNIGALCVLDQEIKSLDASQVELLKILAAEIVSKLKANTLRESLKNRIVEAERAKRKVAHDIRGPLAGIIGLSEIIESQGMDNEMEEVLEFVALIRQSGNSLIELTSDILGADNGKDAKGQSIAATSYTPETLQKKLLSMYLPQARQKNLELQIDPGTNLDSPLQSGGKLLQIIGNLLGNAIKFSPEGGLVNVSFSLTNQNEDRSFTVEVTDAGRGMTSEEIEAILTGNGEVKPGTWGEQGYGLGLLFVKQFLDKEKGAISIRSVPGEGTTFLVQVPQ